MLPLMNQVEPLTFRLIYNSVSKKEQNDIFEQMNHDVQEAVEDYDRAIREEKEAKEMLAKRHQFEDGELSPESEADKKLAKKSIEKVRKAYKNRGNDRRAALEEYEKRVKIRDQRTLEWNSYSSERKLNEIQFDGQTYTTRWSCLPA